jgi:hypothetical protein
MGLGIQVVAAGQCYECGLRSHRSSSRKRSAQQVWHACAGEQQYHIPVW